MEKFIPYEKLSKKEKRRLNLARRTTWGNLNPVTRKPASSKAYNRAKTRGSRSGFAFDIIPAGAFSRSGVCKSPPWQRPAW